MPKIKPNYSARDESCAKWMYEKILELYPKCKKPNFRRWATDIRLMRERDNRSYKEIFEIFSYANQHDFWKSNILSPAKLRAQFDRLALQMQSDKVYQEKHKSKTKPKPIEPIIGEKSKPDDDYYKMLKKFGFNPKRKQN